MKLLTLLGVILCIPVLSYSMERKEIIMGGCSFQGDYRKSNQDRYAIEKIEIDDELLSLTLIADGHAGSEMAAFIKENFFEYVKQGLTEKKPIKQALEAACWLCEDSGRTLKGDSGSTLLVSCFSKNTGNCDVVWVGDSRGVWKADDVLSHTTDHKLTNEREKERVTQEGGEIKNGRLVVVGDTSYEVSRSIGDYLAKNFRYRKVPIIAEPDHLHCYGDFTCYIGACDGFWNVIETSEAFTIFNAAITMLRKDFYIQYLQGYHNRKRGEKRQVGGSHTNHNLNKIAKMLADVALYRSETQCDNITVVLMLYDTLEREITSSSESALYDDDSDNSYESGSDNDENSRTTDDMSDDMSDEALAKLEALAKSESGEETSESGEELRSSEDESSIEISGLNTALQALNGSFKDRAVYKADEEEKRKRFVKKAEDLRIEKERLKKEEKLLIEEKRKQEEMVKQLTTKIDFLIEEEAILEKKEEKQKETRERLMKEAERLVEGIERLSKMKSHQIEEEERLKEQAEGLEKLKIGLEYLQNVKRYIIGSTFAFLLLTIMIYSYYKYGWPHCVVA